MNSQSCTSSRSTVNDMLKAIMQCLDAIKEKLQLLQPLQAKVIELEAVVMEWADTIEEKLQPTQPLVQPA
ncbi:hypothetical protein GUJ93_ZPchr0009g895 [Zizania palustris]|uniref:Uncharacterized protein n=1 Tax=Zizania palustris TaxID=103762 RepID=A0A8J5RKC5_ZIZPA|nr:hypothetical protein GUJ93_ZPchr0009g895 [Zizania palustris]